MNFQRRQILKALAASPLLSIAGLVEAKPLDNAQIIVGFPAGSGPDVLARKIGELLRPAYANVVTVDNRTGAGGQLAVTAVKNARADGSAILLTPMAMLTVYPHTYNKLPYDPLTDLVPVSVAVSSDIAFVAGAGVPSSVRTVRDFMAWAKGDPTRATVGSAATGSPLHFTALLLGRASGVDVTHVGYRGTVAAIPDLLGGRLPAQVCPLGEVLSQVREGKLRVLGTTGSKRSRFLDNVSTFAEQGYTDNAIEPTDYAIFLPAKASSDTIANLNAAIRAAVTSPAAKSMMDNLCLEPAPSSPEGLNKSMRDSLERWGPVVKSIGFTATS